MEPKNRRLVTDTFCILPWLHLHTWPNGKTYQCCITGWKNSMGDLNHNTMEEIWNNDYMKSLRKEFLNNEKPSSCVRCYNQEDKGTVSFRQNSNAAFYKHADFLVSKTREDGHLDNFDLKYWDFRFTNLCNMKCRMCGDFLSSLWAEENNKRLGGNSNNKFHMDNGKKVVTNSATSVDLYKYLDMFIDSVEEIYFAGGEPLIMEEHYYILEKLIEHNRTDVRIRYNTNLSKLEHKGKKCIELWSHFRHININASLDAMGARGEYSRKGTVWKTVDNNLKTILNTPGLRVGVSPTINIFNVWHFPDFLDYLFSINVPEIHLNNVLVEPAHYNINMLHDQEKQAIRDKYAKYINTLDKQHQHYAYDLQCVINFLNDTPNEKQLQVARRQFREITDQLDAYRKENFCETFPELADFYKSLEVYTR